MSDASSKNPFASFSDEDFEKRQRYGRFIFWLAVAVEAAAVAVGFYIAFTQGYSAFEKLPDSERNSTAILLAIASGGPFLIIALVEPTKLALAYVLYNAKRFWIKVLFLIAILAVTFVTFETMFNGLLNNNIRISRDAENIRNQRQANFEEIQRNRSRSVNLKVNTPEKIRSKFGSEREKLQFQLNKGLSEISDRVENETSKLRRSIDQIRLSQGGAQKNLTDRINSLEKTKNDMLKNQRQDVENVSAPYKESIQSIENQLKSLNEDKKNQLDSVQGGFFGTGESERNEIYQRFSGEEESLKNEITNVRAELAQEINRLVQTNRDAIRNLDAQINDLRLEQNELAGISTNSNDVENRTKEIERLISNGENEKQRLRESFEQRINNVEQNRLLAEGDYANTPSLLKELDDQYDLLIKTEKDLKFKYRQAVSQLQVYQLTSTACGWFEEWCFGETFQEKRIEEEAAQKTEYDNELKQVEKTEPELVNALQKSIARRSLLNKLQENGDNETLELYNDLIASAGDVVVKEEGNYEVTLADNKFDLADLPEEKIKFVSGVWFGSIAFIVASMGTFLAYGSYVLGDRENFRYKPKRAFSRLALRLTVRFARILWSARDGFKELGMRGGNGLKNLLTSIGNSLEALTRLIGSTVMSLLKIIGGPFRSIQKLFADIRRSIRRPKIKIKEVEVVVEKEVIKEVEVEVEKEIVKEVIKEVPVEKLVIQEKEVEVEVIRKELVYVPLFTAEKGHIEVDPNFLKSKLELQDPSLLDWLKRQPGIKLPEDNTSPEVSNVDEENDETVSQNENKNISSDDSEKS